MKKIALIGSPLTHQQKKFIKGAGVFFNGVYYPTGCHGSYCSDGTPKLVCGCLSSSNVFIPGGCNPTYCAGTYGGTSQCNYRC